VIPARQPRRRCRGAGPRRDNRSPALEMGQGAQPRFANPRIWRCSAPSICCSSSCSAGRFSRRPGRDRLGLVRSILPCSHARPRETRRARPSGRSQLCGSPPAPPTTALRSLQVQLGHGFAVSGMPVLPTTRQPRSIASPLFGSRTCRIAMAAAPAAPDRVPSGRSRKARCLVGVTSTPLAARGPLRRITESCPGNAPARRGVRSA